MKIGDLVRHKLGYMSEAKAMHGIILSVGYGEEYTDTEQSCALHPDIWVLSADGVKERWNEKNVKVISESRR